MENNAKNIKALRLKTGLTQKEMAERYGVGIRTWQKKRRTGRKAVRSYQILILNTCCYWLVSILILCWKKEIRKLQANRLRCSLFGCG